MGARPVAQVAMDEKVIEDEVVEEALEQRQKAKEAAAAVRQRYEDSDERAKVALERLELPVGAVARVGRFRIERKHVNARFVESFETKAKDRVRIFIADD